jgi:formate hydrogenlyase subunit 3/multisubunit Na+/H+ antiporter MnhD subunit
MPLRGILPSIAFLSICAGAFAKAGAIPLHGWIPDSAEAAPVPVMALLPASLDKLLGIYLLARICLDVFAVAPNSLMSIFLLFIGSVTIIAGVMAALVQHDLKKLLSFHAVSQVGYMLLGIGSATSVGIAGGLFHMLNNAVYKCCLFLSSGAVEKETGTTELDKLGGLGEFMPITFMCTSIAALSISGVPPFNGFASKWMIYQGLIDLSGKSGLWIIWLVCAMIGSALTLASFLKVIHSIFLGQRSGLAKKTKEVSPLMWAPMAALAILCIVFGVFAFPLPLSKFIIPSVPDLAYAGSWHPLLATCLLIIGLLIGALIYLAGRIANVTVKAPYIGGEVLSDEEVKVPATGFYNTIRDWGPLDAIYRAAEKKMFDVYEVGSAMVFRVYDALGFMHNGLLYTYLAWMFVGFIVLFYLMRF